VGERDTTAGVAVLARTSAACRREGAGDKVLFGSARPELEAHVRDRAIRRRSGAPPRPRREAVRG